MFGMLLCFCYLDSHLSSCASCPFKGGRTLRVLRWAFYFFLLFLYFVFFFFLFGFFSLRWSVCPLFLQERITGLHFSFSSSVSRLRRERSEGCAGCSQRTSLGSVSAPVFAAVTLSSVYIHSKLYMLVFFFFSNKKTMNFIMSYVIFLMLYCENYI